MVYETESGLEVFDELEFVGISRTEGATMKTLAVMFWVMGSAGVAAYFVQNKPAPAPVSAVAPVVTPATAPFEYTGIEPLPMPHSAKPRTPVAQEVFQPGLTRTLFVTPPAPYSPYVVTMYLQPNPPPDPWQIIPPGVPMARPNELWAGVNPFTAPNSQCNIVYAYRTGNIDWNMFRVFFTTTNSYSDWGGCMMIVTSETPFNAIKTNSVPSVLGTPGWSFRMTD